MMRELRQNVKWIMALTAVTFVGLMVFGWGMDITGRSGAQATGGELGRVNGDPITYTEYNTALLNNQAAADRQGATLSATQKKQIEEQTWNQLVMTKLIAQELRRRGIDVTPAEIRQTARFAPPQEFMSNAAFQTNGQFDLNKYHEFLASPQADDQLFLQLEQYYRELIPRSKLYFQTTAGTYLSDGELWRMWRDSRETAKVRYIFIDPTTLIADNRVTVSDRDVASYYREHKDEFKKPARAKVKYVSIDRTPTAADTAAARTRALAVKQQLAAGGKWEEIAPRESADSTSGQRGGELGKMRRGATVPAFDQAMFSLPLNQLSDPVQTQFGYHIMQVKSRTADEADVRHVLIPFKISEQREEQLLTLADSLENLASDRSFDEAARALNLTVRTAELQPDFTMLPGVGDADEGAIWVFDESVVGEPSDVFEAPNAFYLLEVLEKTEEGIFTQEEAKTAVTAKLMQERKLAEAREIAKKIVDQIRAGATLDQAALNNGLKVETAGPFTRIDFVPGLGRANAAIGTAFGLKPNQISGVVEAEGALFIIQTLEKTEANRAEFEQQKVAQQAQLAQAFSEQRWNQYLDALRRSAKIVDNRKEVLRPAGSVTTN